MGEVIMGPDQIAILIIISSPVFFLEPAVTIAEHQTERLHRINLVFKSSGVTLHVEFIIKVICAGLLDIEAGLLEILPFAAQSQSHSAGRFEIKDPLDRAARDIRIVVVVITAIGCDGAVCVVVITVLLFVKLIDEDPSSDIEEAG